MASRFSIRVVVTCVVGMFSMLAAGIALFALIDPFLGIMVAGVGVATFTATAFIYAMRDHVADPLQRAFGGWWVACWFVLAAALLILASVAGYELLTSSLAVTTALDFERSAETVHQEASARLLLIDGHVRWVASVLTGLIVVCMVTFCATVVPLLNSIRRGQSEVIAALQIVARAVPIAIPPAPSVPSPQAASQQANHQPVTATVVDARFKPCPACGAQINLNDSKFRADHTCPSCLKVLAVRK